MKSPLKLPQTEQASADDMLKEHIKRRAELMEKDKKMDFSYDLEATLTQSERKANEKLIAWREEIANDHTYNTTIHNFFVHKEKLEKSTLYRALNVMPKGAHHHIHTTAANPINAYLELTYDDKVYYSKRDRLFKVFPKHENVLDGYIQCTKLRDFNVDSKEFDEDIKNEILLRPEQADNLESHDIWKSFQHKFTKVGELGKYVPFFKDLLRKALLSNIKQNIFIVEYRHISGMLFDDDKKQVDFVTELKIIREIVDELQVDTPHFDFRLIITGLKIVGIPHVTKMLEHIKIGSEQKDKRLAELIAGFDLVNEEDFTPEISAFAEIILDY